jgi:uncharacterized protein (TIGR03437 family)
MWRFLFLCSLPAFADNTIVRTGFDSPGSTGVAPGQIMRLVVRGVGGSLTEEVTASQYPLPTTLAGISVVLREAVGTAPSIFQVPILSVAPIPQCQFVFDSALPCGRVTAITVQIPYSIAVTNSTTSVIGQLVVSENGVAGDPIDVNPVSDAIHIVAVVRSNGTVMNPGNPASPGEEIAMFAYGLGYVLPGINAGEPAPNPPARATARFAMTYDFRAVAPPYRSEGLLPAIEPSFIGLTPGVPGLYQINFRAPTPPAGDRGCQRMGGIIFSFVPRSNVTINLMGPSSFDGIGICVNTPQ